MRVRFPREAVTVKRGVSRRSQKTCPYRISKGCGVAQGSADFRTNSGLWSEAPVFSLFSLCDFRYNKRKERWITNKKTRNIIIAAAILLVLVVGAILAWQINKPVAQEGAKKLVVTVVHGDGSSKDFSVATDAEFLRGALEEQNLIEGSESEYGLFVTAVDGETADDSQQQWWCFSKDGEMLMTGVDTTPIADGEHYEITLTTGW